MSTSSLWNGGGVDGTVRIDQGGGGGGTPGRAQGRPVVTAMRFDLGVKAFSFCPGHVTQVSPWTLFLGIFSRHARFERDSAEPKEIRFTPAVWAASPWRGPRTRDNRGLCQHVRRWTSGVKDNRSSFVPDRCLASVFLDPPSRS